MHIARAGRPSMGELADSLVLDRSALAHNLKPLARDGFIEIVAHPSDRRTRLVALTEAGRAKVAEAMPLWKEAQRRFEVVFGEERAQALRATLAVLSSSDFAEAFVKSSSRSI
jgi:DNA-binding MarR family transcriptional regulator